MLISYVFKSLFFLADSFNRPKLSACATWNPNGTTFADSSTVGTNPYGVFVDSNNTVYAAAQSLNQVQVWYEGNPNTTTTISGNLNSPEALFVATNGDLYVDDGTSGHVTKFIVNTNNSMFVMNVSAHCTGLFIDNNNSIYCSMHDRNQVVKMALGSGGTPSIIVGNVNGTTGSTPTMLSGPHGLFIDEQFNLYVTDTDNGRIQKFEFGQSNGTTLAGNGVGGISLSTPIQIVLDADGYLFITEWSNQIIAQGPNGFRCIVGCSGSGSASYQLSSPEMLSFDSYGNIYVMDANNNRLQKFFLATNSCGKYENNMFSRSSFG
jgi:hypothetical protein